MIKFLVFVLLLVYIYEGKGAFHDDMRGILVTVRNNNSEEIRKIGPVRM